jgi:hypothetical protein
MDLFAILGFAGVLVVTLMTAFSRRPDEPMWALVSYVVGGSLFIGAVYIPIALLPLRPSAWNAVWVFGLPIGVAILRRPSMPSLALSIPLLFGGWMSFAVVSWALHIPIVYD